ncbi:MAG TPA: hypothetical protein VM165_01015 [Planctomycetaceae bacterium]|nr:hypothetical protein [Planctomycetaceae bacterium]
MPSRRVSGATVLAAQVMLVGAVIVSYAVATPAVQREVRTEIKLPTSPPRVSPPRLTPLVIAPLYDDPEVVSDRELADVLAKVQPRFTPAKLKPNFVEHALRTWSVNAKFTDPEVMSGEAMKNYLVDHGKYLASWGDKVDPLLSDQEAGVAIRWGKLDGASVHHDHWLASLTEAGVSYDEPVFTPSRRGHTIGDVLQQALWDFRVDEAETEWSALAFGLWLPPQKEWQLRDGRRVNFDLLADRLMRGDRKLGVCAGTHRVYSLMVLIRLDDEFQILSPAARDRAWKHLEGVRDAIAVSQFPDGHWPSNWPDGAEAVKKPLDEELYKKVIATGHHLEWLAIAPTELHPPRDRILKAADWVIGTTRGQSATDIIGRYTFFSHVGNSLALWRKTHPADFWRQWEADHPTRLNGEPVSALEALTD